MSLSTTSSDAVSGELPEGSFLSPTAEKIGLVLGLAALTGCGGGDEDALTRLQQPAQAHQPELLGNTASTREAARAWRWPTADEWMNWAEVTYPTFFPGPVATMTAGDISYRFYASTANYLAVQGSGVFVLGPLTNNAVTGVGSLADFANLVLGANQSVSGNEAARFLAQAAFGGNQADIAQVQALGMDAWISAQLAQPRTQSHWDWMTEKGYAVTTNIFNFSGVDNTLWRKLMSSPDVLRQRVALALSEILVVSMDGLPISWRGMATANYMDILETYAFDNYRTLLEKVTLSVAMGSYLNMRGNQKADGKGREPDENYAREIMQLFTIGVVQLNNDGTVKTAANGAALETYTTDDIRGLARVFTGWDYDKASNTVPDHAARPMAFISSRHSPEEKKFLGVTLPASTDGVGELKIALDTLFNHPNVGPFIGKQLIQRLVTSNPSSAYVNRVATVFNNNGAGVRGDLPAVIRAILMDPEARTPNPNPSWGKLREPIVRMVQWARTFDATSPTGLWNVGNMSSASTRLGQSPLRSPTVFNFFRPGYVPPNTSIGVAGLTAPEFQITNESTVVGYVNWMQALIPSGVGEVKSTYSAFTPLATDVNALFDTLNTLLSAGQLSAATKSTITTAITSMSSSTDAQKLSRVQAMIWLIMSAPEYLVQK